MWYASFFLPTGQEKSRKAGCGNGSANASRARYPAGNKPPDNTPKGEPEDKPEGSRRGHGTAMNNTGLVGASPTREHKGRA